MAFEFYSVKVLSPYVAMTNIMLVPPNRQYKRMVKIVVHCYWWNQYADNMNVMNYKQANVLRYPPDAFGTILRI